MKRLRKDKSAVFIRQEKGGQKRASFFSVYGLPESEAERSGV